jgi:hypothetical protein
VALSESIRPSRSLATGSDWRFEGEHLDGSLIRVRSLEVYDYPWLNRSACLSNNRVSSPGGTGSAISARQMGSLQIAMSRSVLV